MSRLSSLLRTFALGRATDFINGWPTERRDAAIAEMQARYDHLAGVPG